MDGNIFSIEEFSTFDGPGIRTTVFLKGCPLRCQWCHNPEGQCFEPQLLRSPNGCLGCGACIEAGRIKTGQAQLVEESIPACPKNLIRVCGEALSAQELFQRLENKLWMLNTSGGGVTFSGGEPLRQQEFLTQCLQLLAGKTHRAIQTSGFASSAIFTQTLAHCEYVLFDLKHMDSAVHQHYTGVENKQILSNYRTLVASGVDYITRIPLIPGVNDTPENLCATAQFMQQHGANRVELLPYNKGAGAKYNSVGRRYLTDFDPTQTPDPHTDIFEKFNIEVHVL